MSGVQSGRVTRVGLIGFGEAGRSFAAHLTKRGDVALEVFDKVLGEKPWPSGLAELISAAGIHVSLSVAELLAGQDVVFCLVTPEACQLVAQEAAHASMPERCLFLDLNTTPPTVKQACASLFTDSSCYVDGSIMDSFQSKGALVPILLAGPRAVDAASILDALGLRARSIGTEVGSASAIKMCRSIFTKGAECLFVEALLVAEEYGVTADVLASIEASITSGPFVDWVNMLVTTHAVHAARRSEEMAKIAEAMAKLGIPAVMSGASRDRLLLTKQSGIREHLNGRVPHSMARVLRLLASLPA